MISPPEIDNWTELLAALATAVGWPVLAPVKLPLDECEHPYPTEWWYLVGHFEARRGAESKRVAFETTVFRLAEPVAGVGLVYGGYVAIIDVTAKRYQGEQRLTAPWRFVPNGAGFSVTFDALDNSPAARWTVTASASDPNPAAYRVRANVGASRIAVELTSDKPPILHGDTGRVDLGLGGGVKAAYYSRTSLAALGTLEDDNGGPWSLKGTAWVDHQWGLLLAFGRRWHFFAVQLDGREELAFYEIFDKTTNARIATGATWVDAAGVQRPVDVIATAVTAPNEVYPQRFELAVRPPGAPPTTAPDATLTVVAAFAAQVRNPSEVPLLATFEFWEGACDVTMLRNNVPTSGRAFMELGGYAKGSL
jgi:predicted secreted hydrolase